MLSIKKDNFLIIIMVASIFSYIFCNFFILFKRTVFNGFTFDISNFLFPILYITSDLIQEVYGYEKSRLAAKLTIIGQTTFALLCFISLKFFSIVWLSDAENKIINDNILANIASIITVASIISYYIGDWVNDIIFKKLNNNKDSLIDYSKRAFISSLVEKVIDAGIFNLLLIFLPNSEFTFKLIILPILLEVLVKFLFLPLSHKIIMKIKTTLK